MALFDLELNIIQEYKNIINKYIEILSVAIIFIILIEFDTKPSLLDKVLYLTLGVTFYCLIVKKLVKIT